MGLLDGPIAKAVRAGLKGAGMYKPATLHKVTPGTRTPGAQTAGTNPTETTQACEGFVTSTKKDKIGGTLVEKNDRIVVLFGDSLGTVTPTTRDKVTIENVKQSIVGVDRDAAGATYTLLCRG